MSAINDGGPAFPVPNDANINGQAGMTLRDWFAGRATEADIADYMPETVGGLLDFKKQRGFDWSRQWAKYQHADAMLAERAKGSEV